jgi:hypothetical protein
VIPITIPARRLGPNPCLAQRLFQPGTRLFSTDEVIGIVPASPSHGETEKSFLVYCQEGDRIRVLIVGGRDLPLFSAIIVRVVNVHHVGYKSWLSDRDSVEEDSSAGLARIAEYASKVLYSLVAFEIG